MEEKRQVEKFNSISSTAETSANAGAVLTTVLSSGDPGALGAGSIVKLLQYMKFLNIKYPSKLLMMLKEQKIAPCGITFAPKINTVIKDKFQYNSLPEKFEEAQIHSSFFVNVWELSISLAITLAAIIFILGLECAVKNSPKLKPAVQKIKLTLKWNFPLTVFCSNFGDLGLYTAIEIQAITFDSAFSILSFSLCISMNLFAVFILFRALQITKALYNIRKKAPQNTQARRIKLLYKKWESYRLLFQGFHNFSVFQQMFTLNLVVRAYAINIIVCFFHSYPLIQTITFTVMSFCMILYLLMKMPMLSTINNIQQVVFEIIILVANVCAMILCAMDTCEIENLDMRNLLGDIIMYTNVFLTVASPAFLALKLMVMTYRIYLARKAAKRLREAQKVARESSKQNPIDEQNPPLVLRRPKIRRTVRILRPLENPAVPSMGPVDMSGCMQDLNRSRQVFGME